MTSLNNILVGVRVRPLNSREEEKGEFNIIKIDQNFMVLLDPVDVKVGHKNIMGVLHRSKEKQ